MNICILVGNLYLDRMGGVEYRAWLLARGLVDKGHQVTCIMDGYSQNEEQYLDGVKIKKFNGLSGSKTLIRDYEMALDQNFDVIVNFNYDALRITSAIAHRIGIAYIWCVANITDCQPVIRVISRNLKQGYRHYQTYRSISGVRWIACQTEDQRSLLERRFGRKQYFVIPNGHPLPAENQVSSARRDANVIWIGNIKRIKRPELFLETARALQEYDIRFTMVGRAPDSGLYQKVFNQWLRTAPPNLTYPGSLGLEEVNQLLLSQKILVCTSLAEGFPNTFIQAWMRGVPVVSLFDPDRMIEKNGVGVPVKTLPALVDAVKRLCLEPGLRQAMSQRSIHYSRDNFSIEKMVDRYESAFLQILGHR